MGKTLLIVEDEEDLRIVLQYSLQKEGFTVYTTSNGSEGIALCKTVKPDLLILDLNLPDMSGIDVCSTIRSTPGIENLAILMLTAKTQEQDRVKGFEVGADDYVLKPFSTKELILRIKALLRRSFDPQKESILTFGNIRLEPLSHQCFVDEEEISLTALEFRLLQKFLENIGIVLTREILLQDVWNMDPKVNTRTVDKHVQRLRNKLGVSGNFVHTIRGIGYRLRLPKENP